MELVHLCMRATMVHNWFRHRLICREEQKIARVGWITTMTSGCGAVGVHRVVTGRIWSDLFPIRIALLISRMHPFMPTHWRAVLHSPFISIPTAVVSPKIIHGISEMEATVFCRIPYTLIRFLVFTR